MNLSNKTNERRGKFETKAKENQLNTLQSAEVENHEVFLSNAWLWKQKTTCEITLLGSNSGIGISYLCALRLVI